LVNSVMRVDETVAVTDEAQINAIPFPPAAWQ
jgi:hypothetical protein